MKLRRRLAAIANEGCGAENPFACRSARSPRRLNCVDHAHFNKLRMIVPIANVLKAGKPLFCGLDRPLAAPGGAALIARCTVSQRYRTERREFLITDLTKRYVVVGLNHCRGVALPGR